MACHRCVALPSEFVAGLLLVRSGPLPALFGSSCKLGCLYRPGSCVLVTDFSPRHATRSQAMQGRGPNQEVWRNTVKVERCRYLEASKCKGTCMNLCKLPTEAFFKEDLGKDAPRKE